MFENAILNEYLEILEKKADVIVAQNMGELLINSPHSVRVNVSTKWLLIVADPDDNKFVDCAIAGNADFLVTNDRHFNILKDIDFPPVNIVTIDAFLDLLQQRILS